MLHHLKQPGLGVLLVGQHHHLVAARLVRVSDHNLQTRTRNNFEGDDMVEGHGEDAALGLLVPVGLAVEPDAVVGDPDDGGGVEARVDSLSTRSTTEEVVSNCQVLSSLSNSSTTFLSHSLLSLLLLLCFLPRPAPQPS